MPLPPIPSTHRWVYGDASVGVASDGTLVPAPDSNGTVWNAFTDGSQVIDLYAEDGTRTRNVRTVAGVARPIAVPVTVTQVFADFGQGRFPLNQIGDFGPALAVGPQFVALQAQGDALNSRAVSMTQRLAAIDAGETTQGVARVAYDGLGYPSRYSFARFAEFVGPVDPIALAVSGDTWVDSGSSTAQPPASVPTNVTAATTTTDALSGGVGSATIAWQPPDVGAGDVASYHVGRDGVDAVSGLTGGYDTTVTADVRSFKFTNMAPATTYSLFVEAIFASGITGTRTTLSLTTPALPPPIDPIPGPQPTTTALTRSGTKLMLDGAPIKFVGFNMAGATGCQLGAPYSTTQMNDYFSRLRPRSITRTFGFQSQGKAALGQYIAAAERAGQMLVISLFDGVSNCGETEGAQSGAGSAKSLAWYQSGYKTRYLPWVRDIVTTYKGSPAIGGWEIGNEPVGQSGGTIRTFYDAVGSVIKGIDPDHLVWSGQQAEYSYSDGVTGFKNSHASPYVDVCSLHEYDYDYQNSHTIVSGHWSACKTAADQLGKPCVIGEVGIIAGPGGTSPSTRVTAMLQKYDAYLRGGCAAVLVWNAYIASPTSAEHSFGLSDPLFPATKSYTIPA